MEAMPKVCGKSSTSLNPLSRKILLKASPHGNAAAESDKYLYALLSLENNFPIKGRTNYPEK